MKVQLYIAGYDIVPNWLIWNPIEGRWKFSMPLPNAASSQLLSWSARLGGVTTYWCRSCFRSSSLQLRWASDFSTHCNLIILHLVCHFSPVCSTEGVKTDKQDSGLRTHWCRTSLLDSTCRLQETVDTHQGSDFGLFTPVKQSWQGSKSLG